MRHNLCLKCTCPKGIPCHGIFTVQPNTVCKLGIMFFTDFSAYVLLKIFRIFISNYHIHLTVFSDTLIFNVK